MKKSLLVGILFVLALAAILTFGRPSTEINSNETRAPSPSETNSPSQNIILLSFDFGNGQRLNFEKNLELTQTLFEIIEKTDLKIETENFPPIGKMITSINGFKNGTDGKYWQYWINGQYAQIGASAYKPKASDQIEWRFTPTP